MEGQKGVTKPSSLGPAMESSSRSLISSLSPEHVVRRWWTGQLPESEGLDWPDRPDSLSLDAKRKTIRPGMDRERLVLSVEQQYDKAGLSKPSRISALGDPTSRTVTTGHQLCLAGGPAYTYFKIRTAVELARRCELRWGVPVVPVFWLASEDHDFEEVRRTWDGNGWRDWTPPSPWSGAVGRMGTEGLQPFLELWSDAIGLAPGKGPAGMGVGRTLSHAMRRWVHAHFDHHGVVVVDGDDPAMKAAFADVMQEEVTQGFVRKHVEDCNAALRSVGIEPQVFVRDCNLFHLEGEARTRLVCEDGKWASLAGKSWVDEPSLLDDIAAHPEAFSPNALLRPVYQSWILPDVAVVGGLAEVAYWLQLPGVFAHLGRTQPALVPRDAFLVLPRKWTALMLRCKLSLDQLELDLSAWESEFMKDQPVPELKSWRHATDREAESAAAEFAALDGSLEGSVKATLAKVSGLLDKLEAQARRAVRRKEEESLGRLAKLDAWVHPDGKKQERVVHFDHLQKEWGQPERESEGLEVAIDRCMDQGHGSEDWSPLMHFLVQAPL